MLRPIGEALSRRTTVAAAQAHAMAGANGHVSPRGPLLTNHGLRVHGMVKLSCGPAPTPSAGVGAIFFRKI